jgi:hypothetical protein
MAPFDPLLRSPHLQTIAAHFWKRPDLAAEFPIDRRLYRTEQDVQVLVCSQRPRGQARGEIFMVHGLEGSGEAGYIRSLSAAALGAGFAAHRFHMRTCGGTEHLSLGGNMVLKLAGEMGESAREFVRGVCTVSAPLDLAACARRIGERDNRVYQRRFVRAMRRRLCATGRYQEGEFAGLRSVLELDDRFTAPSFGFGDAANYYRTQSSIGYLPGLRVPALLIQAKDDTFVPFAVYQSAVVRSHPCIQLMATEHGGHLGFIGRRPNRLWLDETIMSWIMGTIVNETSFNSSKV